MTSALGDIDKLDPKQQLFRNKKQHNGNKTKNKKKHATKKKQKKHGLLPPSEKKNKKHVSRPPFFGRSKKMGEFLRGEFRGPPSSGEVLWIEVVSFVILGSLASARSKGPSKGCQMDGKGVPLSNPLGFINTMPREGAGVYLFVYYSQIIAVLMESLYHQFPVFYDF